MRNTKNTEDREMNSENILKAARILSESRHLNTPLTPLRTPYRPRTIEEGYHIQHALQKLLEENSQINCSGYKIGCTTKVMQNYLNIAQPCAGSIINSSIFKGSAELDYSNYVLPGVECEIVARIGKDIPNSTISSPDETVPYVDALMIGIEIVDNRYTDFRSLGIPTLVADNFFNAGCVLGDPIKNWLSLEICELKGGLTIDGSPGLEGQGTDIMGNPLAALAWLVNQATTFGQQLKAGDFVMLGSLVKTHWFAAPGKAIACIPQLGEISVVFN